MLNHPIVDPHLHVWDIDRLRYPWLDQFPLLNRTFTLDDFDAERGDLDVAAFVFVNCEPMPAHAMEELAWVESLAERDPRLQATVPYVAIEHGDAVAETIEGLAGREGVRGVRRLLAGERDGFAIQDGVLDSLRRLGRLGLHFELTLTAQQLPEAIALVERCPDTRFILDHCGNPDFTGGTLDAWDRDLRRLASNESVTCKVSNLTNNADVERWAIDDLRPAFDTVVEAFGPRRLMWAGDWPHCLRSVTYRRWVESAAELTAEWPEDERRGFFLDHAARVYRLDIAFP